LKKSRIVTLTLGAVMLAGAACGGSSDDGGVASINQSAAASDAPADSKADVEKQLIAYTQCLRDQGIDIADPQVDADGNLRMGGVKFQGGGGDRSNLADQFTKAREVCGEPPEGAGGMFSHGGDQTAMQDALVKFAECMRGQGVDVPDPDFSGGVQGGGMSILHDLDRDDPKVSAAMEQCQSVFTDAGVNMRIRGGAR
jgi:hypothetical protein